MEIEHGVTKRSMLYLHWKILLVLLIDVASIMQKGLLKITWMKRKCSSFWTASCRPQSPRSFVMDLPDSVISAQLIWPQVPFSQEALQIDVPLSTPRRLRHQLHSLYNISQNNPIYFKISEDEWSNCMAQSACDQCNIIIRAWHVIEHQIAWKCMWWQKLTHNLFWST